MGYAVVYEYGEYSGHNYDVICVYSKLEDAVRRLHELQKPTQEIRHERIYRIKIIEMEDDRDKGLIPTIPEEVLGLGERKYWKEVYMIIKDDNQEVVIRFWHRWSNPIFLGTLKEFYDNDVSYRRIDYSGGKSLITPMYIHDRRFKMIIGETTETTLSPNKNLYVKWGDDLFKDEKLSWHGV